MGLFFCAISVSGLLLAAKMDYPYYFFLTNPDSTAFDLLTGNCSRTADDQIKCVFNQTRIKNSIDPAKLEQSVEETLSSMTDEESKEVMSAINDLWCSDKNKQMLIASRNEKPGLFGSHELESAIKRIDFVTAAACEMKGDERLRRFVTASTQLDAQTCTVWSNTWEQSFQYNPSSGKWTSKMGPNGDCGVINVSTLSKAHEKDWEWTYETRKVVTNREGPGFLLSCSDLDENTYRYRTSSSAVYMNCLYLKYGMN